ncbi:Protein transport protein sec20 [Marasmius crinis-equi]|uniref:Protein transport protein sec20 n=1 Tax=Marasmius crinis-equi TaxID=585013 RepID=A0ABR3EZD1_9AGAR
MPPIPSAFDAEAIELIESSDRIERDIVEVQIPRLRDGKGASASEREEIRGDLDKLSRKLEDLNLLVDDQTGERNRRELRSIVEVKRDRLRRLRQDTRDALLASKRTGDTSNREELLRSNVPNASTKRSNDASDDVLMEANNNVTESLRRVVGVMQGELERSVLSVQMLESSTSTLQSTSLAHNTLTMTLDTSKSLVTALSRADKWDRAVILAAFVFFLLVVGLVVKERVFDKSLRVMFWWTRFLPDFSGDTDLLKAGGGIVSGTVSVTSSLASSLSHSSSSLAGTAPQPTTDAEVSEVLMSTLTTTPVEAGQTSPSEAALESPAPTPDLPDSTTTSEPLHEHATSSDAIHEEL